MKIILSRKGFDSGYGGCASPIFPDGSMASFPIPYPGAQHQMWEVLSGQHNLGHVVEDLTRLKKKPITRMSEIHLDPDLRRSLANRCSDWRAALGQDGAAQTHLVNQNVDIGDIFLFFGWFRRVEKRQNQNGTSATWNFVLGAPDVHVIFGWLQVGSILRVGKHPTPGSHPAWLNEHPHIRDANKFPANNTLYISSDQLVIDGVWTGLPGGGTFEEFSSLRQLTDPANLRRTAWQLPDWFHPFVNPPRSPLSCHSNPARWTRSDALPNKVNLASVPIGQEFILDGAEYADAGGWLQQVFTDVG